MRKRILYVSVTNWGVGDELALRGAQLALQGAYPGHLAFLAEKNPEFAPGNPVQSDLWAGALAHHGIDLVVYAGGESWTGPQYAEIEDFAIETQTPIIYLGVGMHNPHGDDAKTRKILERCPVFIARDHVADMAATRLGAPRVWRACCPSLFIREPVPLGDKPGLVFQAHNDAPAQNCGPEELEAQQISLFSRISARTETLIICHFIGDYIRAMGCFPEYRERVVYSRFLDDYIGWYTECGSILSMRLHGAYLGAMLGRPTICLRAGVGKACALGLIGVPVRPPASVDSTRRELYSDPEEVRELRAQHAVAYAEALAGLPAE